MIAYFKIHLFPIGLLLLCSVYYLIFGYDLVREDYLKLICLAVACFYASYKLLSIARESFGLLLFAGILYRLVLFFSIPELSQDFYRYLWDGSIFLKGINPFLYSPNELIDQLRETLPNAPFLYEQMGELSQKHYSNYPPVSQYLYALAAYIGQESVLVSVGVFRVFILGADVAILFLSRWLMQQLGLPKWKAFWYFLNPLVVLELSGNLHLEGIMIAFFLAGICVLLLAQQKLSKGILNYNTSWLMDLVMALCISLAIMTKLIPILFYPFLLRIMRLKRWFISGLYIVLFSALLLWPLLGTGFFSHYIQTIGLWFNNFEFNASLYNLIKSISQLAGHSAYRTILTYGKILPILIVSCAIGVWVWQYRKTKVLKDQKQQIKWALTAMLFIYTGHLFLATTVHPWYLIFGLLLSLFTPYRYFIVWSLCVFLSYVTYAHPDFKENLWVLGFEYLCVFAVLIYEIVRINPVEYFSVKNV